MRSISELHSRLTEAVTAHPAVSIDTSAVESIDVAAVQLLVSATRTAAAQGRTLTVTAPENGPVARTLVGAGLFTADGTPKSAILSTWTISREAA